MTIRCPFLGTGILLAAATVVDGHTQCVSIQTGGDQLVPYALLSVSRQTTALLFHQAGFTLTFVPEKDMGKRAACVLIRVEFLLDAPEGFPRNALADALPFQYGGTQIRVIVRRALRGASSVQDGIRLGYVLSHEIGHVLQGLARHSETGVMKASWGNTEFAQMLMHSLAFQREDLELMHAGAATWRERAGSVLP